MPRVSKGLQPTDGGNLIISTAGELEAILAEEPQLGQWIHPFVGSDEFIKGGIRWCFWLSEASPDELRSSAILRKRLKAVREMREASSKASTRNWASRPHLFTKGKRPGSRYVIIPSVSSERRRYIPMGFLDADVIPSNLAIIVPDADMFHFGVLCSQFHNAWMRAVCGRMKSDYRYSNTVVYNNFVWPVANDGQRAAIEAAAQGILDARALYPSWSLADLYDPDKMPPELRAAHKALDAAVEAAYGVKLNGDEEKTVAHLFKLYAEMTEGGSA